MVLIILSWIYQFVSTINFGFLLDKIARLKVKDFAVLSILGLFSITLIAGFWAVFERVNWEFHVFLFLTNLRIFLRFKEDILAVYQRLILQLKTVSTTLQILLGIIFLFITAQCASRPFVIDNESYYIQTIKWLNEYGFVKGLANLHPFLGQTSGWHIAQSAFDFSFLYDNFNDFMASSSGFSSGNIIFPHANSMTETDFELLKKGNLNYYSPEKNDFFWGQEMVRCPVSINRSWTILNSIIN